MTHKEAVAKVAALLGNETKCYVSLSEVELIQWLNDECFERYLFKNSGVMVLDGKKLLIKLSPLPANICPHCGGKFTEGF